MPCTHETSNLKFETKFKKVYTKCIYLDMKTEDLEKYLHIFFCSNYYFF